MKIAVISANSRTGQAFVSQAVAEKLSIHAGFNYHNNLATNQLIKVIHCDATKKSDIKALIAGCDIVLSLIGHSNKSPSDLQTLAIQNVIESMKELKISRLISLTGTGVRQVNDKINILDYLLNISIRLIDPARIKDGIKHAQLIEKSGLNWTIVRVLKLTNQHNSAHLNLSEHGPSVLLTPRLEVARLIIQLIKTEEFYQKMPIVSKDGTSN